MANIFEPAKEQIDGWYEFVRTRPDNVRKIAEKFYPWKLYRMKSTGHRCTLVAISESGTLRVEITGEFNSVAFNRQVFGIEPDDLEECDLPGPDEQLGSADMDPKEAFETMNKIN